MQIPTLLEILQLYWRHLLPSDATDRIEAVLFASRPVCERLASKVSAAFTASSIEALFSELDAVLVVALYSCLITFGFFIALFGCSNRSKVTSVFAFLLLLLVSSSFIVLPTVPATLTVTLKTFSRYLRIVHTAYASPSSGDAIGWSDVIPNTVDWTRISLRTYIVARTTSGGIVDLFSVKNCDDVSRTWHVGDQVTFGELVCLLSHVTKRAFAVIEYKMYGGTRLLRSLTPCAGFEGYHWSPTSVILRDPKILFMALACSTLAVFAIFRMLKFYYHNTFLLRNLMTLRLQNQELISRNDSLRIANKQLMRLKEDQTISIVALTATADDLSQQNAQLRNELLACRAERDEATLSPEPCSCTLADSVLSDDLDLGSDDGSDAWNETEDMRRELLETKEALTAVEATLDSVARDNKELRKELFDLRCGGSLASSREASTSTSGSWTPGRPSPFFNFFIDSAPDAESPIPPLAFELSSPSSPSFPFTPMSAAFPLTPYPPSPPIRFAARTNVSGNVRRALAARIPHSIKARKMRVLRNMDRRSRDEFI